MNGSEGARLVPEERITEFTQDTVVPDQAKERAALAFIDFCLCVVAGTRDPAVRKLAEAMGDPGWDRPAAPAQKGPPPRGRPAWAFLVGAIGHILDCDDNQDTIGGHPSCVLIPALLARLPHAETPAADLFAPYVVGVEVMAAVSRALGRGPYEAGWHTTSVYGTFGGAAALARSWRARRRQASDALGAACAMASGIKASFGSNAKAVQVGHAAMAAVLASELAAAGCSAGSGALSGPQGLAQTLGTSGPAWGELSKLGTTWECISPGIVFKRFPCCASNHAVIEAALALQGECGPGRVPDKVTVEIHPGRLRHVDRPSPGSGVDAKFSIQFAVANALLTGRCTIGDFSDGRLADVKLRRLMDSITVRRVTDGLPWSGGRVTLQERGRKRSAYIPAAVGHDGEPPTIGDLAAKGESLGVSSRFFDDICGHVMDGGRKAADLASYLDWHIRATAGNGKERRTGAGRGTYGLGRRGTDSEGMPLATGRASASGSNRTAVYPPEGADRQPGSPPAGAIRPD